jgi:diguanylate cyclase (GGDEF)-like protein
VLFLYVDHFNKFNDVHGHLAGDEVLRHVAHSLLREVREDDVVARYGGEEFVVLSGAGGLDALECQARQLCHSVEHLVVRHDDQELSVTVSVGGAWGVPQPGDDRYAACLLKVADSAMYESKANGRNRVTVVDLTGVANEQSSPLGVM